MRFKLILVIIILIGIVSIVLATPDIHQRRPNVYDPVPICTNPQNAYDYDGSNADCSPNDFNPNEDDWWNNTDVTGEHSETINSATFGTYASCTGTEDDDDWMIQYGFSSTGNCTASPPATWTNLTSDSSSPCPFSAQWFNVSNTTEITWTKVNNTCWRIWADRNRGPDGTTLSIDAFHVDVDYQVAPSQYCTGSDPYPYTGGDWVITGETVCENEEYINVTGNITIQSSGTLNLINSTIGMENVINASNITNKGTFLINKSSNITTNASDIYFYLISQSGTTFQSNDSFIEKAGWSAEFPGIDTYNDNLFIKNVTITSGYRGLNSTGTNLVIYNTTIDASQDGIALYSTKDSNISKNTITAGLDGIFIYEINNSVIDKNNINADDDGIGGYSAGWVNFTNITYNTIVAGTTTSDRAISILKAGINNTIKNNKLYGYDGASYVRIASPLNTYLIFENNELWVLGTNGEGAYFEYQNYLTFVNNTIYNATNIGFHPHDTSNGNYTNNTIVSGGTTQDVFQITGTSSNNNFIYKNNFTNTGGSGVGIYFGAHNFTENNITSVGTGLYLASNNNNITDNTIEITGSYDGIIFDKANNTLMKYITLTSQTDNGINSTDSIENSMYDSSITSGAGSYDFWGIGIGNMTFYDVSFEKSKIYFETGSTVKLFVYWSVIANVTDDSGTPIQDANVTAYNVSDIDVWWNLTNATGFTNWTYLEEYEQDINGKIFETNYTFNATKDTYDSSQEIINLTYPETQVNITLTIPISTTFTILMPTGYTCQADCFNITALTEATANETDSLYFNASTYPDYYVEPCRDAGNTQCQSGASQPIFLIDNTGNTNIDILIRRNATIQSGITLFANASCSGCSSTETAETELTTSYYTFITGLTTTGWGNITFYMNISGFVGAGEYETNILTNSSQ
ncbi:MAG: right-handed parallel beta-helix repeat-containing protein [Candidatus Aenigmatarchaeota archaeon]